MREDFSKRAADHQILASVVSNLVQNAFKFTRPHGHIKVRAHTTADRVLIDVQDECGGLQPEFYYQTRWGDLHVWLTVAGVLTVGASWPVTAYVPLAVVTASGTVVTGIVDARNVCSTVVPIAQPTGGAATAGASWTSVEEGMLNAVYSALRALGLLS